MEAHLGALSSPPPPTPGTVQVNRKTLASDIGKVVSAGNGRGHVFPQSFPLGPEPGPLAGIFCFVLWAGGVERLLPAARQRLGGRGTLHASALPACAVPCATTALPGERTPIVLSPWEPSCHSGTAMLPLPQGRSEIQPLPQPGLRCGSSLRPAPSVVTKDTLRSLAKDAGLEGKMESGP